MKVPHQLVYEFRGGCIGILFLCTCCAVAGIPLIMLLTGVIEGTTDHPLLGAFFVFLIALGMGIAVAGRTDRTVIDREARTVSDHWSVFGIGSTRCHPLSEFECVIVRRWLRLNGRIRKKVILAGKGRQIVLAHFYTLKGARENGESVAAFCGLPLVHENWVPKFWPTA